MNHKQVVLKNIKNSLTILEKGNQEEFDIITAIFTILHEATSLLGVMYDLEKIKTWKHQDDPAFYRFVSKVKTGLEIQMEYLNSISDQLIFEENIVSQKIMAYQMQINTYLKDEKFIIEEVKGLIDKEAELTEAGRRIDALLAQKEELQGIANKIATINTKELEADIAKKEKKKSDFENRLKPLLDKNKDLDSSIMELSEAFRNLSAELARLETAHGEEAQKITENIPKWIAAIKKRLTAREQKNIEYMERLKKEAEELRETEIKIQEQLEKCNEFVLLAMGNAETLRIHFKANREIGGRFASSLPDMQESLSRTTSTIEKELSDFDQSLAKMQKRIEEITASFRPMRIGG